MAESTSQSSRLILLATMTVFVVVAALFVIAFGSASLSEQVSDQNLSADSYQAEVAELIADADPEQGELLVQQLACAACHIQGGGQIAPLFDGIATRAEMMRPPLTASAYLYESIVFPQNHLVEGYANAMPNNYLQTLTSQQLGDILAYLLTLNLEPQS